MHNNIYILLLNCRNPVCVCPVSVHNVHTSAPKYDLIEFFDKKENWGESSVKVGKKIWKPSFALNMMSNKSMALNEVIYFNPSLY